MKGFRFDKDVPRGDALVTSAISDGKELGPPVASLDTLEEMSNENLKACIHGVEDIHINQDETQLLAEDWELIDDRETQEAAQESLSQPGAISLLATYETSEETEVGEGSYDDKTNCMFKEDKRTFAFKEDESQIWKELSELRDVSPTTPNEGDNFEKLKNESSCRFEKKKVDEVDSEAVLGSKQPLFMAPGQKNENKERVCEVMNCQLIDHFVTDGHKKSTEDNEEEANVSDGEAWTFKKNPILVEASGNRGQQLVAEIHKVSGNVSINRLESSLEKENAAHLRNINDMSLTIIENVPANGVALEEVPKVEENKPEVKEQLEKVDENVGPETKHEPAAETAIIPSSNRIQPSPAHEPAPDHRDVVVRNEETSFLARTKNIIRFIFNEIVGFLS